MTSRDLKGQGHDPKIFEAPVDIFVTVQNRRVSDRALRCRQNFNEIVS